MRIATSRFGTIECPDQSVLSFPDGILGFPLSKRYVVLDHDRDVPFKWLQSADEPHLAFVIADPVLFATPYDVRIPEEELRELGQAGSDVLVFVLVTVRSEDPPVLTGNLRGPVVVNPRTRAARQIILRDDYPTRCPLSLASAPV
ncbi:flagellar assembly protein FliW [Candidatus Nitrospira bockiana]